jgi:hypothetical protein
MNHPQISRDHDAEEQAWSSYISSIKYKKTKFIHGDILNVNNESCQGSQQCLFIIIIAKIAYLSISEETFGKIYKEKLSYLTLLHL